MPSREIKSLDQLMDGQIVRRFNAELQKVWENIFDPRTDAYKPRQIALIFKQPFSPFVVRFAEGHKAALLESDGGAWRVEAVRYIGNYLKDKLQDSNVVVIA